MFFGFLYIGLDFNFIFESFIFCNFIGCQVSVNFEPDPVVTEGRELEGQEARRWKSADG